MAKKCPVCVEGAPEWMLTYGDMITLVLCFFVLLFSMSEIKKPKVTKTMRAFQRQFGVMPHYKATVQIFMQTTRMTQTEASVLRRGVPGRNMNVKTLVEDDRTKIIIGGKDIFRPGEAELSAQMKGILQGDITPDVRGYKNRIEIRGHTASAKFDAGIGFSDPWYLGYQRAYNVMRYLIDKCGIDERRFRVVSCADTEPLNTNLSEKGRQENRRVEIIMTEQIIREMGTLDR